MKELYPGDRPRWLRGGLWGPLLVVGFALALVIFLYGLYIYPNYARAYGHNIPYNDAMFGPKGFDAERDIEAITAAFRYRLTVSRRTPVSFSIRRSSSPAAQVQRSAVVSLGPNHLP